MTALRLGALVALLLAVAGCAGTPDADGARFRGGYGGITAGGATGR